MFARAEEGRYNIILMDIKMPVMNGYDATKEIRRLKKKEAAKIPIFAMTANAFAEDIRTCMEAGMDAHCQTGGFGFTGRKHPDLYAGKKHNKRRREQKNGYF